MYVSRLTNHNISNAPAFISRGGGADGSIITFEDVEMAYAPNAALDDIVDLQKGFINKYKINAGDLYVCFIHKFGMTRIYGCIR